MFRLDLHQRTLREPAPAAATAPPAFEQPGAALLSALRGPQRGTIYDLDAGRWPGMPTHDVHPPFTVTTYRTPRGAQVDGDLPTGPTGVLTELVSGSCHTGTHIDALAHITLDGGWFGGGHETTHLGDFGPTTGDAAEIPPLVCRGIMLDIAALHHRPALERSAAVGADDVEQALSAQGLSLQQGDAVLIRTGFMSYWGGDEDQRRAHYGAGLTPDAARLIADAGAVVMGTDTDDFEQVPSAVGDGFLPVHVELLVRRGIYIIELLYLEDLARDRAFEFLFVCLPLRIRGATGSMVRPIAIV